MNYKLIVTYKLLFFFQVSYKQYIIIQYSTWTPINVTIKYGNSPTLRDNGTV